MGIKLTRWSLLSLSLFLQHRFVLINISGLAPLPDPPPRFQVGDAGVPPHTSPHLPTPLIPDRVFRLERLEFLISRRPELLNSVMLRQNPHNVAEWHKRVKLFEGNPTKQILTYTEVRIQTAA
jgi:hypothetical protein